LLPILEERALGSDIIFRIHFYSMDNACNFLSFILFIPLYIVLIFNKNSNSF